MSEKIIGIDLGTTNSCVAVLEHKQAMVLNNAEGGRTTPSVVSFDDSNPDSPEIVGITAVRRSVANPESTVASIKRLMGRKISEVSSEIEILPYNVTSEEGATAVRVEMNGKLYSPEEISSFILKKIKEDAESYLDEEITKAVITVPAYFNDAQRLATKQAAEIAGLEVLRLINEPTAAALAYGFGQNREETLLVFDLGGGTFDVSVLEIGDDVFEVLATAGDNHLGGDDFDAVIVNRIVEKFKAEQGIDLSKDKAALHRLYDSAQKAKIELSTIPKSHIALPFISSVNNEPVHLEMDILRSEFQQWASPLLDRLEEPISTALREAGLSSDDIDHVILVGGMTRMPAVADKVVEIVGKNPHKNVNPDEAVAIGAAIQAGVLVGEIDDVLLLDVIPLSLGIETKGGMMSKLIPANKTVPFRITEIFTTAEDNQPSVEVHILQGERSMAADNRSLGKLQLRGIPPAHAGIPKIEVIFDIDADGILSVSARDLGTNKKTETSIEAGTGLSDKEIAEIRKEAIENRDKDAETMRQAADRVSAEVILDRAYKQLTENQDQMSPAEQEAIYNSYQELKELLENEQKDHPSVVSEISRVSAQLLNDLKGFAHRIYGETLNLEDTDMTLESGRDSEITYSEEEAVDVEIDYSPSEEVLHPKMPTSEYKIPGQDQAPKE